MTRSHPELQMDRDERDAVALLAGRGGIGHTSELVRLGVRPAALIALWRRGRLIRLKAGLYQLPEALAPEHASLVQVAHAVPNGVICLVSALDFYGLTDHNPEAVWMALPMGGWAPKVSEPPVQFVHFRSRLFRLGVDVRKIGEHSVRVYSPEKTLCDCLRLPEIVGRDVTLIALRRYLRGPDANVTGLLAMAEECRVGRKMAPYIEALVA